MKKRSRWYQNRIQEECLKVQLLERKMNKKVKEERTKYLKAQVLETKMSKKVKEERMKCVTFCPTSLYSLVCYFRGMNYALTLRYQCYLNRVGLLRIAIVYQWFDTVYHNSLIVSLFESIINDESHNINILGNAEFNLLNQWTSTYMMCITSFVTNFSSSFKRDLAESFKVSTRTFAWRYSN